MLIRARHVLPLASPPLEDGAVRVAGGKIVAVGPWTELRRDADDETIDLGEQVLMPGLINAHCHLDYSGMRGVILPPESFTAWVGRINALKRELTDEDYLEAIAEGFAECLRTGTTTLVNIEAFAELMPRLPPPPIRTWWCYELIDIRQKVATDPLIAGALSFFGERPGWLGGFGLSPHAPYTASAELYRLALEAGRAGGMPVTTHLGESIDEHLMFTEARGPLHDFLRGLGRPMDDCGRGESALTVLANAGAIDARCLVAHLNLFTPRDEELLGPGGALHGLSVVHCPSSHAYFGHPEFRYDRLRELGVNLCLGTDSLASAASLNLFAEMREFRRVHPTVSSADLLAMVTTHPARALGAAGKLGVIAPGAQADLIALPWQVSGRELLDAVALGDRLPTWGCVAGRPTLST